MIALLIATIPLMPSEHPRIIYRKRSFFRTAFYATIIIVVALLLFAFVSFLHLQSIIYGFSSSTINNLRAGGAALQSFDVSGGQQLLSTTSRDIESVKQQLNNFGLTSLLNIGGNFFPNITVAQEAFKALASSLSAGQEITRAIQALEADAMHMMFNGEGEKLIVALKNIRTGMATLQKQSQILTAAAATFGVALPHDYSTFVSQFSIVNALLQDVTTFLDTATETHIALFFQNPSELRPAGGFIGSYADLTLANGNIRTIAVNDIYYPDGKLTLQIFPPRVLQPLTPYWGARDANWFFDFPTSAAKVLSFLEQSPVYRDTDTHFSLAIAISTFTIIDMLKVLPPITLPEYNLTLTSENFLEAIQQTVESSEDKTRRQPKRILQVFTPLFLEALSNLTPTQKQQIATVLKNNVRTKNIMAFSPNRSFEIYLNAAGLGGALYREDFSGFTDYFAWVDSNIASGKTDAFIDVSTILDSVIADDGSVLNAVTVTRTHNGATRPEWWYNKKNKNYFQLLTPLGSTLLAITGHDQRTTPEHRAGLVASLDPDLQSIESTIRELPELRVTTFTQFKKTTFANYVTTPSGESRTVTLRYALPKHVPLKDTEINYRFVFERQSGNRSSFQYTVHAPSGFIWRENNSTTYVLSKKDPDGRIILDLTLIKK